MSLFSYIFAILALPPCIASKYMPKKRKKFFTFLHVFVAERTCSDSNLFKFSNYSSTGSNDLISSNLSSVEAIE